MSEVSFKRQIFVFYDGGLFLKCLNMALLVFANILFIPTLTRTVMGYFELHMTGGGGGGGSPSDSRRGRLPRNLAHASKIAQRERPRCYFSQKMHILSVMIINANHMHKLFFFITS